MIQASPRALQVALEVSHPILVTGAWKQKQELFFKISGASKMEGMGDPGELKKHECP